MEESRMNENEQLIEQELEALLKELRSAPVRDPEAVRIGRGRFTEQVDAYLGNATHTHMAVGGVWISIQNRIAEVLTVNKFAVTAIAIVLAAAIVLFGSATATVSAANEALPGDALYSIKMGIEQTQVRLAGSAFDEAMIYLDFAERRLDETAKLITGGRFEDVPTATQEFKSYVKLAIETLGIVAAEDPGRAEKLASHISETLGRYTEVLLGMLVDVPDTINEDLQRALLASEGIFDDGTGGELEFVGMIESIDGESWVISGRMLSLTSGTEIKGFLEVGNFVKVHALVSDSGELIAREIELSSINNDGDGSGKNDHESSDDTMISDDDIDHDDSGNLDTNENHDFDDTHDGDDDSNIDSSDNDDNDDGLNSNDDDGEDDKGSNSNENDDGDENENDDDDRERDDGEESDHDD